MKSAHLRRLPRRAGGLALVLVGVVLASPASAQSSLYPTGYVYLDSAGNPLPFQDKATILEALRTAEVVERKQMSRGIAKNIKLLLEFESVRFGAVLRLIEVTEQEETGSKRMVVTYRDSRIFEAAAYELSEILGIGRVPPTVERNVGGARGTVQIWMEGMAPEDIMLEEGRLKPPNKSKWWKQKAIMWVFDALIANTDRNQGNLLIDKNWNLWLIDHTRAFRETAVLFDFDHLDLCERQLWNALVTTDDETISERLGPYLTSAELTKLFLRKARLVKHFNKRIKKHGEERILYDLGS
jgi:hypothetical protein